MLRRMGAHADTQAYNEVLHLLRLSGDFGAAEVLWRTETQAAKLEKAEAVLRAPSVSEREVALLKRQLVQLTEQLRVSEAQNRAQKAELEEAKLALNQNHANMKRVLMNI